MSSQDQNSNQLRTESPAPAYEKLCCFFLGWDDATSEKNDQIKKLYSLLHDKYGAFSTVVNMDHTDLKDSECTFTYVVENFVKENDSQKNLLIIIYSGSSYVHESQLFLEPHQNTEPTVQWTHYIDQRILLAVARVLLIFDTTNLRPEHYTQMWKDTCRRMDAIGYKGKRNVLSILATDGSGVKALTSSLSTTASANPGGFTVSQLRDALNLLHTPRAELYTIFKSGYGELGVPEVVLLPLARPRLKLYEHHVFADPHDEYLQNYITIHRDGSCHVIKVSMGPDIQQFSASSCVVAVKRFSIKQRTRPHVRNDFLQEKERLVQVSKWNHPHLLGMLATFETQCSGFETLNIVLPFAGGGNLYDFLRLERETRWEQRGYPASDPSLVGCLADWRYAVFREVAGLADAVAALHRDNNGYIMHCDIKPANVLIQRGIFKLADFGLSRFKESDQTSKTEWHRGTPLYSPPERDSLSGRGRDVWALGCVFLEIAHMIRFAFQDAIIGKLGKTQEPQYEGLRNIIDVFEFDRKNSVSKSGKRTAIYHETMGFVRETMRGFQTMRPGLRKRITVDGMFPVIEGMMHEDQTTRITAAEAAKQLSANYLSLQKDPQLQEAIRERHNPGGPPADVFDDDEWIQFQSTEARASFSHGPRIIASGGTAQHDNSPYRRSMIRTATAPAGSSGATKTMVEVALDETKRPSSSEDISHRHAPLNRQLAPPLDLGGTMQPPGSFGVQNQTQSSSMDENSSHKRRKTDGYF